MSPDVVEPGPHPRAGAARLALFVLTFFWGSTFVVVRDGLDRYSPAALLLGRFAIAFLALALPRPRLLRALPTVFVPALPLSLSLGAGFTLQTVGLQSTTPARSAFVTALAIVVVPFLDAARTRRAPAGRLWLAVGLAAAGIAIMFLPLDLTWSRGDTLTLLGAIAFAYYIVELARMARRHDAISLVLAQTLTIAAGALLALLAIEAPRFSLAPADLGALLYLGVVCTVLAFLMMAWGQARTGAVEAAVIYAFEPVWAAILSIALGREPLSFKIAAGGALVVLATLAAMERPAVGAAEPAGRTPA